ncbi:uncharacterized protein LOC142180400 [Nicotiana tabacum]|uniref:Uncharacterized protein LOC142180400 n=1 Tax=Nicotiana tabacum TaxID=4097 RepID=A0AC58UGV6_TOBAC
MHEAWLVIGDFNNVLPVNDRINGQPVHQTELVDFQECIKDIGSGKDTESRTYSNIDWAFGNASWLTHYSSIEVVFEMLGVSDHSPIIINTDVAKTHLPKPFRLYNVLLNHKEFKGAVHELIAKKKELLMQIKRWEGVNEQVHRQRSRAMWIKAGDQNTKFFHDHLKARQSRNRIASICNDQGLRVTDPILIEQEFRGFFQTLLGTSATELPCIDIDTARNGHCLTKEQ